MAGGYPRPSHLLEALREAEAARVRCQRLLPTQWFGNLDSVQSMAAHMEEPLQLMVELQGDSLLAPPGPASATIEQRVKAVLARSCAVYQAARQAQLSPEQLITCTGCTSVTSTLRKCAACKQAQYCRCALSFACACTPWLHLDCTLTRPFCLTTPPAAASARSSTGRSTRRHARRPSAAGSSS